MVIRLLWLRENNVDTWEMIDLLMDHREDKNYEVSKNDEKVVKFIRQYCRSSSIKVKLKIKFTLFCRLKRFSKDLILRLIGIIDTNVYIIGQNKDKDVDIQGLFPITSIINHSCHANAVCFATEDFRFKCRAQVDIYPGEEITTNYLYHQYHMRGTSYRRPELEDWYFTCTCDRYPQIFSIKTLSVFSCSDVKIQQSLGLMLTVCCVNIVAKLRCVP